MAFLDKIKLRLKEKGEAYFDVKVRPAAPKSQIIGELEDGTLKIDLAALAEKGKANEELVRFLAGELGVDKNNIKILSGKTDRKKLIKVEI